jgi:hypothetical protein
MIKIEQLKNGAKATIIRNEVRQPVYTGMTVTAKELGTIETTGTIVYSIDEVEVLEIDANTERGELTAEEPPKSIESSSETLEASGEATEAVKPTIVKPAPRSAKK